METTALLKLAARCCGLRRGSVAAARMYCERQLLAVTGAVAPAGEPRVLCYHSVGTPLWGVNDVSPERFRAQIEHALAAGYRFVPADQIARGEGTPFDLAITFDDGLRSVMDNAAPILSEYAIPWTLFIVADWADNPHLFGPDLLLGWDDIARLAHRGVRIGSHSLSHPTFTTLDADTVHQELAGSRATIASRLGIETAEFAIPMGQSQDWSTSAQHIAIAAGYTTIYAQTVTRRTHGTVSRTFVTKFDTQRMFRQALRGRFDTWEEWR